jgi:hypothetical protein
MGNREHALAAGTEALAVQRCTRGSGPSEHSQTLVSTNSFRRQAYTGQNYGLVLPLYEEVLDVQRRTLGNQHVQTLVNGTRSGFSTQIRQIIYAI